MDNISVVVADSSHERYIDTILTTIAEAAKVRGTRRIIQTITDNMKQNHFAGGQVVISHCLNPEFAIQLKDGIQKIWNNARVMLTETGGLCSFYAERSGLIVAY